MKYSPDAYLLHESSKFITFNIRIKVFKNHLPISKIESAPVFEEDLAE